MEVFRSSTSGKHEKMRLFHCFTGFSIYYLYIMVPGLLDFLLEAMVWVSMFYDAADCGNNCPERDEHHHLLYIHYYNSFIRSWWNSAIVALSSLPLLPCCRFHSACGPGQCCAGCRRGGPHGGSARGSGGACSSRG